MSSLSTLGMVFTDPHQAFTRLRNESSPWLPLLALVLPMAALMYWWGATVDTDWLFAYTAAAEPQMSGEERAALKEFMGRTPLLWSTVLGTLIGTPIALMLSALYYLLAGRLLKTPFGFGKWFAFACWSVVPLLLALPLIALQIATGEGQVANQTMNPASLAVLFRLEPDNPWLGLASAVDFTIVWSLVVSVIGLKAWTGRSTSTCALVVAVPTLLIFGGWALSILMTS